MFGAGCLRNPHVSFLIHCTPIILILRLRILAQWYCTRVEKRAAMVGDIPNSSPLMSNGASPVLLSTSSLQICEETFNMFRSITLPQIEVEPRMRERQNRQTWEVWRVTVSPFVVKAGSCPREGAESKAISSLRSALNKKIFQSRSSCKVDIKGSFALPGIRWAMGKI